MLFVTLVCAFRKFLLITFISFYFVKSLVAVIIFLFLWRLNLLKAKGFLVTCPCERFQVGAIPHLAHASHFPCGHKLWCLLDIQEEYESDDYEFFKSPGEVKWDPAGKKMWFDCKVCCCEHFVPSCCSKLLCKSNRCWTIHSLSYPLFLWGGRDSSPRGLEIPHSFQQPLIVLLAPHQDGTKQS